MDPADNHDPDLGPAIAALASGKADRGGLTRVAGLATSSMRAAGARSVTTGRWLTEAVLDAAPHVPVRDVATLSAHHGGLTGAELAGALIRSASRTTAGLGAVAGALAGAEELAPPMWLAIPAELVVETLAVVAVEMKLVAELQAAYGRPIVGSPADRGLAVARAWAEGRGVTATMVAAQGGIAEALGRTTRREVTRLIQRRLARRAMRSLSALAPFMAGAVAGAELNRRATRRLGESVVRDLAAR
ncbi:MAG: hypothetical protein M3066_14380 [Actinomycetota bacterium]|nr:hypothetical protein [Actinomycetota bacterium]